MGDKIETSHAKTSILIKTKESSRKREARKSLTPDAKLKESARKKERRKSVTPDARLKESTRKRERRKSVTPDSRLKESARKRETRKSVTPDTRLKESTRKKRQRRLTALSIPKLAIEDNISVALRSCYASNCLDDHNLDDILE